jgi:hypothetical protein
MKLKPDDLQEIVDLQQKHAWLELKNLLVKQ